METRNIFYRIICAMVFLSICPSLLSAQQYSNYSTAIRRTDRYFLQAYPSPYYDQSDNIFAGEAYVGRKGPANPPDITSKFEYSHKMCYQWDISGLPKNATVTSARLEFWYTSQTDKANTTDITVNVKSLTNDQWNTNPTSRWTAIKNASSYCPAFMVGLNSYPNTPILCSKVFSNKTDLICMDINNSIQAGTKFCLALMTGDDEDWTSGSGNYRDLEIGQTQTGNRLEGIKLTFSYTVPPVMYTITVKNSFNAGSVVVDDIGYVSGRTFNWLGGTTHKLTAIDRPYIQEPSNGKSYYRIYQNWAAPNGSTMILKPYYTTTFTVTGGGTFTANFKKEFNLIFANSYSAGQLVVDGTTQNSGYLKPLEQNNSISFSATSTTTYNGWDYTFSNWTADNGDVKTVTSPNIPTDHTNYIANYSKKLHPMAEVNGTTAVDEEGTHPKITWSNTDLAPEVTEYKIYQKYGKTGSIGLIAHVNGRNTTQFIDYPIIASRIINPINYYVSAVSGSYESATTRCAITYLGIYAPKLQPFDAKNTHDYVSDELPSSVSLLQNYPNPWNPTTTITFALPVTDYVKLVVYDMLGREVKTLVDGDCSAGYHSVEVDGSRLSSGMYFYKLQVGSHAEMKKMQLIK